MSPANNIPPSSSDKTPEIPNPGFVVVDASVWVSRLVPQDAFHQSVKVWMEIQRSEGVLFISPALLLAEAAGAISQRTGEPRLASDAVDRLSQHPGLRLIEMDQKLVQDAARLAAELGMRGADAFYTAAARRLSLPLATLDENQKIRAAAVVEIFTVEMRG